MNAQKSFFQVVKAWIVNFLLLAVLMSVVLFGFDLSNGVVLGTAFRVLKEIGLLQMWLLPVCALATLVPAGLAAYGVLEEPKTVG